jgi:hypothetical protein
MLTHLRQADELGSRLPDYAAAFDLEGKGSVQQPYAASPQRPVAEDQTDEFTRAAAAGGACFEAQICPSAAQIFFDNDSKSSEDCTNNA